ncbi:MAG TPA: YIP1 family protein [Gammaproteobacteria bacterium]|jgi:hypothetical protein
MADKSSLAVAIDLITAPNQAFAAIKERPSVWLPLIALIVSYAAVSFAYTSSVDIAWLTDQQLQRSNPDMTDLQREQLVRATTSLSPTTLGAISAVTAPIAIVIGLFISALYLTGVSFLTHDGVRLKQWFAFSAWCFLPIVFGLIASLINILVSDARFMAQDQVNPLAFGNLLAIDREGLTGLQRGLLSVDITALWSIVLCVLGYQAWTKRSTTLALAVVLGPLALIIVIGVLLS